MKITVTKALGDIKVLEKRINSLISDTDFVNIKVKSKDLLKDILISVGDYSEDIKAKYQSIQDLINNRNKLKSAIILSNAITDVEIAGKKYKVAEAIDRKNSIEFEIDLLDKLKSNYAKSLKAVEMFNEKLETQINKEREIMLSGDNAKNKDIVESVEKMSDAKRENNAVEIVDPLKIKDEIEKLDKSISDFQAEVDQALSISNAVTLIDIEFAEIK